LFLGAFGEFFLAFALGLIGNEGIEGIDRSGIASAGIAGSAGNAKAGSAGIAGNAELILSLVLPGTITMIAIVNPKIVAPIITKGA